MNGKNKCKILKEIRCQIAQENDIAYVTSECKHKGDCLGTCPKCEAEVRYLEEQLQLRRKAGKAVAVAGIAASLMVTASGCDLSDILHPRTGGAPLPPSSSYEEIIQGGMVAPAEDEVPGETKPSPTDSTQVFITMGDVVIPTDTELMGEPMPEE